jgi:hypothetical protein
MVHAKAKSGDPDFDDKVPMEDHVGQVVTAGDGTPVLMSESLGPVNAVTGEHVNIDDPKGDEGDNRPAPGDVATEQSTVQVAEAPPGAPEPKSVDEFKRDEEKRQDSEDDQQSSDRLESEDVPRPRGRRTAK